MGVVYSKDSAPANLKGEHMSKINEYYNDPDHKCGLCGEEFPYLTIKNEFTGQSYCSDKCLETDEMVSRADCEQ